MFNIKTAIDSNVSFINAFVDLKVEGYKSFTKAYDAYTMAYFAPVTKKMQDGVIKLGDNMKSAFSKISF
jgi:hypothetical protein